MSVSHVGNGLDPEGRRALLARIAASPRFQKAPRLRQLITYIGDRSLDDEREPPREIEIGLEVFGRSPEYDTSEDNIVRNAARQLRAKLKEYFEQEGIDESWTVNIPKGGYRAVFAPRPVAALTTGEGLPNGSARRLPRWIWAGAAVLLISLAVNLYLWLRNPAPRSKPDHLAARLFPDTAAPLWIVVGDFGSYLTANLQGRPPFNLDEYIDRQYLRFSSPAHANPVVEAFGRMLTTRHVVSMGEMNAAVALHHELSVGRRKAEVRHARTLTMRDLRHDNLVIAGTRSSNPWLQPFEERLRFRMLGNGFVDSQNQREFRISQPAASGGRGYVRISATASLTGRGCVLLINGVNMGSVEAGAEFALNPDALRRLHAELGTMDVLPQFEAVLETSATDFTPNRYRVVAVHRHGSF